MKIYIWEGNGISDAYHDDGTLVVLAHSPEEARQVVLADRAERNRQKDAREAELATAAGNAGYHGQDAVYLWRRGDEKTMVEAMHAIDKKYPLVHDYSGWDGSEAALSREPDQTVELTTPCIVAFNGGGYD